MKTAILQKKSSPFDSTQDRPFDLAQGRPEISDIDSLRQQKIANRLKEIPKKYRKIYRKAVLNNDMPTAIKAFCLECVGWQKNEVANCSCLACPLYGLRPF